ncbi:MAG: HYR domain-containing protein [bacterium]|nr:HYR domain-containing protein [bacterium]
MFPVPVGTARPPRSSTFPVGTTTVGCTATDKAANTASGSFKVTVVGMTPPSSTPFSAFQRQSASCQPAPEDPVPAVQIDHGAKQQTASIP